MPDAKTHTAARLLVLAAMAYGLGARECGCWEHSGWRAAFATPVDGAPNHRGTAIEARDCEHERETVATMPPRRAPIAATGSFAPPAFTSASVLPAIRIPTALPALSVTDSVNAALPVCALLQVLRL